MHIQRDISREIFCWEIQDPYYFHSFLSCPLEILIGIDMITFSIRKHALYILSLKLNKIFMPKYMYE